MKKKGFIIFVVLAVLMSTGLYFIQSAQSEEKGEPLVIIRKDGSEHAFKVEIAATPVDQEIGLMFRTSMEKDHGMLFEMESNTIQRFWMKNTLIPLDMVFIAPDGTIRTIHENAVPESLAPVSSEVPVNAVLELNGGRARALNIMPGDKVVHPYFAASK